MSKQGTVLQYWTLGPLGVSHIHWTFDSKSFRSDTSSHVPHVLVSAPSDVARGLYALVPGATPGKGKWNGYYTVRELFIGPHLQLRRYLLLVSLRHKRYGRFLHRRTIQCADASSAAKLHDRWGELSSQPCGLDRLLRLFVSWKCVDQMEY